MTWREKLASLGPVERKRFLAELEAMNVDAEVAEIEAMSDEELTLWLARNGHSPEDTRLGLIRFQAILRNIK